MAHNTRTRAHLAAWATGAVTQAEFNSLDTQAFESINGDQGGVWAPLTVIEIGGAGMYVHDLGVETMTVEDLSCIDLIVGVNPGSSLTVIATSTFSGPATFGLATFNDDATFNDPVTFTDFVTFQQDVTFNDPVDVNDTLTADNVEVVADLDVGDDLTVGDDLVVEGDTTLEGHTTIGTSTSDDLLVLADAVFDGNVVDIRNGMIVGSSTVDAMTVNATSTFIGDVTVENDLTVGTSTNDTLDVAALMLLRTAMTFTGNGRVPFRVTTAPDANTTFSVADANIVRVPTLTATRFFDLSSTGAQDGDWFWFFGSPGQIVNFTVTDITAWNATGFHWVVYVRMGGAWRMVGRD